jgi:hypothetical protein
MGSGFDEGFPGAAIALVRCVKLKEEDTNGIYGTEDTKDTRDTEDTKDTRDTEDTKDTRDTEDTIVSILSIFDTVYIRSIVALIGSPLRSGILLVCYE